MLNELEGGSDKSGAMASARDNSGSQSCFFANAQINKEEISFQYNYI